MFIMQNQNISHIGKVHESLGNLLIKPISIDNQTSLYDLILYAEEVDEKLVISFQYSKELFLETTINNFIKFFEKILITIATDPNVLIEEIEIDHGYANVEDVSFDLDINL